jgi:hypothetical protein
MNDKIQLFKQAVFYRSSFADIVQLKILFKKHGTMFLNGIYHS